MRLLAQCMLMMALMVALAACANQSEATKNKPVAAALVQDPTPAQFPQPFTIELLSTSRDGRHVYYELHDDGVLHFGGGRDAHARAPDPIGRLTNAQRNQLWQTIQQQALMNAEGSFLARHEKVRYEAKLRAGDERNGFSAVDDQLPGIAALEKLLFEMHTDLRYRSVFNPIEDRIERSGGAVHKR